MVTNKQDLPACCMAMLFNAHLCLEAGRNMASCSWCCQGHWSHSAQAGVAQSHTVSLKLLQSMDANSSERTPIHFDLFLQRDLVNLEATASQ